MAIRKIDKNEIDFSKIYSTSSDAINHGDNTVKVHDIYWGDNGELTFDEETGLVSENGVGLGFINRDDLLAVNTTENIIPQERLSENNSYNIIEESSNGEGDVTVITFDDSAPEENVIPNEQIAQPVEEKTNEEVVAVDDSSSTVPQEEIPSPEIINEEPKADESVPITSIEDNNENVTEEIPAEEDTSNRVPQEDIIDVTPIDETTIEENTSSVDNPYSQYSGIPKVGDDGLIVLEKSDAGQAVINRLYGEIPSHSNGKHSAELDAMIDGLSNEECAWVLSRIEDRGFGQTGSGYAGVASAKSHQTFIEKQLINRFNGDIHNLLKTWGTLPYSGY